MNTELTIGQVVTAQLGNPCDMGYTKETNENVPVTILKKMNGVVTGSVFYLFEVVGQNKIGLARLVDKDDSTKELYCTHALPYGDSTSRTRESVIESLVMS